jgi:hypothetical protein
MSARAARGRGSLRQIEHLDEPVPYSIRPLIEMVDITL